MTKSISLASLVCLTLLSTLVEGSKILLMPACHGSHISFFSLIGSVLQKDGHDVHVLVPNAQAKLVDKYRVPVISMGDVPPLLNNEVFHKMAFGEHIHPISMFLKMGAIGREFCDKVLGKEDLMVKLESDKFDLVLIDNIDPVRCMYTLPYRLGVPYLTIGARHDPWKARVSAIPSAEGQHFFFILPPNASFLQRLFNTVISTFVWAMMPPYTSVDPAIITQYAPKRPPTTFENLYHNSEMWITNLETMCLDFPRVHGFHYQFIAGLGCSAAKPLTGDLDTFVSGAPEGIIVLTFGSAIEKIPADMLNKMLTVFKELPQRIVIRYDGELASGAPSNVLFSKWLPQNDLLGHPKTRLFITHGGNNGQLEALFHGVPMLTMPVFVDQKYNGERAAAHGYGLVLDPKTFTSEQLNSSLQEMLGNPKYAASIKKCSQIFHDMPNPQETVTFWVNHVLKFGGSHLKPTYMDMPMWQFFMVDIIAFCVLVLVLMFVCIKWCCNRIVQKCSRKHDSKRSKSKVE